MKTREGYVSNSSSSSFILKATKAIERLTASDWNEMILDLFEDYDKKVEECRRMEKEYNLEKDRHPVFCAFDTKTDRGEAEEYLKDILEGWTASNCVIKEGKLLERKRSVEGTWEKVCKKVSDLVESEMVDERGYDFADAWIHCHNKNDIQRGFDVDVQDSNGNFQRLKIDEKYLKILEDKWNELGICDNYDVLKNKKARFAIHFDENEYCSIKGIASEGKRWETESFSYGRLCEIFGRWLVKHKKVPKDFDWRELIDATLTVNMHEG